MLCSNNQLINQQKYRDSHSLKRNEATKIYYQKHKEDRKLYFKEYAESHKLEIRLRKRKYHQAAKDKIALQHLQIKTRVLTHYGNGKCACTRCGLDDIRALSIDHINSGGSKHRREIKCLSGQSFYLWLEENGYPKGYQTLCMSCQFIKKQEKQEYLAIDQLLLIKPKRTTSQLSLL